MTTPTLYGVSAPVFIRMLTNLDALLTKAEESAKARNFDVEILAQARLSPNMLPLRAQILIAGDTAKNAMYRLAGQAAPVFEDSEKTFAEFHARIAKTIDVIKALPESALAGGETRTISFKAGPSELTFPGGLAYLTQFALPNFFFHVTAAYSILRHNGVDLGKRDFLGQIQ
jgi:uncharacterized protein